MLACIIDFHFCCSRLLLLHLPFVPLFAFPIFNAVLYAINQALSDKCPFVLIQEIFCPVTWSVCTQHYCEVLPKQTLILCFKYKRTNKDHSLGRQEEGI